jgi:hypothetical protein
MTEIKSDLVTINNSADHIYNFLANFDNFGKLMPEQVINWKSNPDSCSFTIKGMADISLTTAEKTPYSKIVWTTAGKVPFNFSLSSMLDEKNKSKVNAQIILQADLSPMLKMMALRPLTNFVNILVNRLKEITETGNFS